MDKSKEFRARRLFESNRDKFPTKRSASKYLNHFEGEIDMVGNEYIKKLENVIKQMLQPLKDIPFNLVIETMTGKKVISFDFTKMETRDHFKNGA